MSWWPLGVFGLTHKGYFLQGGPQLRKGGPPQQPPQRRERGEFSHLTSGLPLIRKPKEKPLEVEGRGGCTGLTLYKWAGMTRQ